MKIKKEFTSQPASFIIVSARGDVSKRGNRSMVDQLIEYYRSESIECVVYEKTEVYTNDD